VASGLVWFEDVHYSITDVANSFSRFEASSCQTALQGRQRVQCWGLSTPCVEPIYRHRAPPAVVRPLIVFGETIQGSPTFSGRTP
jgi:hypothetical protein